MKPANLEQGLGLGEFAMCEGCFLDHGRPWKATEGLKTRVAQAAKRLCRLIQHTLSSPTQL